MDTDHAALLRAVAKNTNDYTVHYVYADFLRERGNPGHLIVEHYPLEQWAVWCGDDDRAKKCWHSGIKDQEFWCLPWLEGYWHSPKRVTNPKSRIKQILNAYADGTVLE